MKEVTGHGRFSLLAVGLPADCGDALARPATRTASARRHTHYAPRPSIARYVPLLEYLQTPNRPRPAGAAWRRSASPVLDEKALVGNNRPFRGISSATRFRMR